MKNREQIRKLILKALYSDAWLYDRLVMKGGNALSLVYNIGGRSSLDLDFSIENDFEDVQEVSRRISVALTSTLENVGIHVFDYELGPRPKETDAPWWGGYRAEFKLISHAVAGQASYNVEAMRRQALTVDVGSQRRIYSVEISKFEYVREKITRNVDGFNVCVYSPVLIAVEKLRALVQQHPDYPQIPANTKRSRARDLYDIWAICDYFVIKLDMHLPTVEAVFNAKKVDLRLLDRLSDLRALHLASWSDVELSVSTELREFEFYFDFVAAEAKSLYSKWIKNAP